MCFKMRFKTCLWRTFQNTFDANVKTQNMHKDQDLITWCQIWKLKCMKIPMLKSMSAWEIKLFKMNASNQIATNENPNNSNHLFIVWEVSSYMLKMQPFLSIQMDRNMDNDQLTNKLSFPFLEGSLPQLKTISAFLQKKKKGPYPSNFEEHHCNPHNKKQWYKNFVGNTEVAI